jgi:hypothetical protein
MSDENQEEDNVVALCVDCGTTQIEQQMMKDVFLNSGINTVCRFCGGPVIITTTPEVEGIMRKRRGGGLI